MAKRKEVKDKVMATEEIKEVKPKVVIDDIEKINEIGDVIDIIQVKKEVIEASVEVSSEPEKKVEEVIPETSKPIKFVRKKLRKGIVISKDKNKITVKDEDGNGFILRGEYKENVGDKITF